MNNLSVSQAVSEKEFARQQIKSFGQLYGQCTLRLAMYAAFPMALTSKVLYYFCENSDRFTDLVDVPWYAPSDILLSSFCQRVGHDLYEMNGVLRIELLEKLKRCSGEQRIRDLGDFMANYIAENLEGAEVRSDSLGLMPEWTVLACLEPSKLVAKIKMDLLARLQAKQDDDCLFWATVIESYASMLPGEALVTLAKNVKEGNLLISEREIDRSNWAKQYGIQLQWQQVVVAKVRVSDGESDQRNSNQWQDFEFAVAKVDAYGNENQPRERKTVQGFVEPLGTEANAPFFELMAIPGGSFMMGSPNEERSNDDRPQHEVIVQPFFMAKHPVTQAQWKAIAAMDHLQDSLGLDLAPSFSSGDDFPVENINWFEAQEFCRRLTKLAQRQNKGIKWVYRLPTEVEREYACRAGTTTPFHFGQTISTELVNYDGNFTYKQGAKGKDREKTMPAGSFDVANEFGLYDMHGNVWEWCTDLFHESQVNDDFDWDASKIVISDKRILRGGSWVSTPSYCHSSFRFPFDSNLRGNDIGFRVVCAPISQINPFVPLTRRSDDTRQFFEQNKITDKILAHLNSGTNIALVGDWGLGKSSIMKEIESVSQKQLNRKPIYLNLQLTTTEILFWEAFREALGIPGANDDEFIKVLGSQRFLLLIDEAELFDEAELLRSFSHEILSRFRGLSENAQLKIIIATGKPLDKFSVNSREKFSPLINVFVEYRMLPWEQSKMYSYICDRLNGNAIQFTAAEIESIIQKSEGKPRLLAQQCYSTYQSYLDAL
jgi:formylglycine-generating enzyme required for sulfatase activity